LNLRLLARDGALLRFDKLLLSFALSLVLFEQLALLLDFIEEHGVDEVVAHRLGNAVPIEDDKLRGHLGNFFGHQPVLPGVGLVNCYVVATQMGTATPIQLPMHTKGTAGVGAVELKINEVPDT
jgi:hypothetical protein